MTHLAWLLLDYPLPLLPHAAPRCGIRWDFAPFGSLPLHCGTDLWAPVLLNLFSTLGRVREQLEFIRVFAGCWAMSSIYIFIFLVQWFSIGTGIVGIVSVTSKLKGNRLLRTTEAAKISIFNIFFFAYQYPSCVLIALSSHSSSFLNKTPTGN